MSDLGDFLAAPVTCDKCGFQTEKSLTWLETNDLYTCPSCGFVDPIDRDHIDQLKKAALGKTGKASAPLTSIQDQLSDNIDIDIEL